MIRQLGDIIALAAQLGHRIFVGNRTAAGKSEQLVLPLCKTTRAQIPAVCVQRSFCYWIKL